MKPRLQTSLGQHLALTPQLRLAIRLLQMSTAELEAEIAEAIESNPLLDWREAEPLETPDAAGRADGEAQAEFAAAAGDDGNDGDGDGVTPWQERGQGDWPERGSSNGAQADGEDASARIAEPETLHDHLRWQLNLSRLPARDVQIGLALIDGIDDDGYLREPLEAIAELLRPELEVDDDEIGAVLRQVQRFDPLGVGARDLAECLTLQLEGLEDETGAKALALRIVNGPIERLPKVGTAGIAAELGVPVAEAEAAVRLLQSLDPRPGAQIGALPGDIYVVPDCVVWRQQGSWRVALANGSLPRIGIHHGYERLIRDAEPSAAGYLRSRLQEARWLLKGIEARGETLLKVMQSLLRQQAAFLEFGDRALRPLTLREVAAEVGLHESTVSRAIARKYVRTPRGTLPLRSFFASGVGGGNGAETSSTAIQAMIRRLIDDENPRQPLSDARLAVSLKAAGVPVARRTVAKYREAMNIPSSQERVRVG